MSKTKKINISVLLILLITIASLLIWFFTGNSDEKKGILYNSEISMGQEHSSLLTEDGRLFMWGDNEFGQLGNGTRIDKNRPTEITNNFVDEDGKQLDLIDSKIWMGEEHSSLLTKDGRLFMWGRNSQGELGNGEDNSNNGGNDIWENEPIEITNQFNGRDLINANMSLGWHNSSLLTQDGRLFMWGDSTFGSAGNGREDPINEPTEITDKFEDENGNKISLIGSKFERGGLHSSLLTEDGRLFIWGWNWFGQLGNGTESNKNTPINITDQFINDEGELIDLTNSQISLGWTHSSLLTQDGRLFMWGSNEYGQLGDGTEDDKNTPTEITDNFTDVNLVNSNLKLSNNMNGDWWRFEEKQAKSDGENWSFSSLLTEDGRLFMWGFNGGGQLGNGAIGNPNDFENIPTEITDKFEDENEKQVYLTKSRTSFGANHSSLLTNDGRMFMWGDNRDGQLGIGEDDIDKISTPFEITNQFEELLF